MEGAPPGRGVDEKGFGVVTERGVGRHGSFGGWERWVEGDVAVEWSGGRDDDFAALDGEGAGDGGHGAVAVGGLGDGGDGVGEENGVWGGGSPRGLWRRTVCLCISRQEATSRWKRALEYWRPITPSLFLVGVTYLFVSADTGRHPSYQTAVRRSLSHSSRSQ